MKKRWRKVGNKDGENVFRVFSYVRVFSCSFFAGGCFFIMNVCLLLVFLIWFFWIVFYYLMFVKFWLFYRFIWGWRFYYVMVRNCWILVVSFVVFSCFIILRWFLRVRIIFFLISFYTKMKNRDANSVGGIFVVKDKCFMYFRG